MSAIKGVGRLDCTITSTFIYLSNSNSFHFYLTFQLTLTTYLPTYLPTYPPTYSYLPSYLNSYLPTQPGYLLHLPTSKLDLNIGSNRLLYATRAQIADSASYVDCIDFSFQPCPAGFANPNNMQDGDHMNLLLKWP